MYRKSVISKRLQAKRDKCAAMRAAKDRKRMETASALLPVGGIVTHGCLGEHVITLLARQNEDERWLYLFSDGHHRRPQTMRGIIRCLAHMIYRRKS